MTLPRPRRYIPPGSGFSFGRLLPGRRTAFAAALAALAISGVVALGGSPSPAAPEKAEPVAWSRPVSGVSATVALEELLGDSLLGRSGKLRARFVPGPLHESFPGVDPETGAKPGATVVPHPAGGEFAFVHMIPFGKKFGDRVGSYLVGYWPGELRRVRTEEYDAPTGFVEVTPGNMDMPVSEHFRLRDFITHDQQSTWPKYVVLQELLLDKLELVLMELARSGVKVTNVKVLSGFRTPYHNTFGIAGEGGARDSRHQYGDAADIIIDNNGDGRMDDLNGDRRVDTSDIELVLQAVERVERAYPELAGGLGRYHAVGPSGPFVHIDVRGYKARWSNDPRVQVLAGTTPRSVGVHRPGEAMKVGKCNAAPEFAALCGAGSD